MTRITDQGVAELADLKKLERLNLYGTQVTDECLQTLSTLMSLKSIYLWDTGVSPKEAERFRKSSIDSYQLQKWTDERDALEKKIKAMGIEVDIGPTNEDSPPALNSQNEEINPLESDSGNFSKTDK